jgi:hypothetical protein
MSDLQSSRVDVGARTRRRGSRRVVPVLVALVVLVVLVALAGLLGYNRGERAGQTVGVGSGLAYASTVQAEVERWRLDLQHPARHHLVLPGRDRKRGEPPLLLATGSAEIPHVRVRELLQGRRSQSDRRLGALLINLGAT